MGHQPSKSPEPTVESKPSPGAAIDYAPKEMSRGETLAFALKFLAVAGAVMLLFWLTEKFF